MKDFFILTGPYFKLINYLFGIKVKISSKGFYFSSLAHLMKGLNKSNLIVERKSIAIIINLIEKRQ